MASRCRTPFVEPPVAATAAMAFSIASRVMICDGRHVVADELHHEPPGRLGGRSPSSGATAGMPFSPAGLMPEELERQSPSCWR